MWEWVKEHGEWAAGSLGAILLGFARFVWHREAQFRDLRTGHAQLRRDMAENTKETRRLSSDLAEVKGDLERLSDSLDQRVDQALRGIDELRTDIRALNVTLIGVLKRGIGSVRGYDEPEGGEQ